MARAVALLFGRGAPGDHGRIHAALAPAKDHYDALDEDDRDAFRDAVNRFVHTYAFLSQIVAFTDAGLERDYLFCKALAALVRPEGAGTIDLGSEVELTHLKLDQTFAGSVSLDATEGEVTTIFAGTGPQHDPDEAPLSVIVARINERFGTRWAPEDLVFYTAIADKLAGRQDMQRAAAANTAENFRLLLEKEFLSGVVDQLAVSEEMVGQYLDNGDLQAWVLARYLPLVYGKARVAHQEHCPIGELLGPARESATLEYKSTLRTRADDGGLYRPLESACLKTVAGFLNSRDGGTLLIGVADDGRVFGLEADYATLRRDGRDDRDAFQLHLANIVAASMGTAAATNVTTYIHTVESRDLCRVHARPSGFPVDAKVTVGVKGQMEKKTAFYVRLANGTREMDSAEKQKYIAGRWGVG